MTHRDVLLISDKGHTQPSSEQLPPSVDGHKFREPAGQGSENERTWNTLSSGDMSISSLSSGLREP